MGWSYTVTLNNVRYTNGDAVTVKGYGYPSAYGGSWGINYGSSYATHFYGYFTHDTNTITYPVNCGYIENGAVQPNYYIQASQLIGGGTPLNYTLTLNPNGGTASSNGNKLTVTLNSQSYNAISSWLPSRSGYTFKGFYNATSGGTQVYNASGGITNDGTYWKGGVWVYTGNVTLYAQWTPNKYQITYNANGGTGAPGTQTFTFDGGEKISSTKPTRNGYTFVKWVSNPNNRDFAPGATIPNGWGSFTLIAQWTANKITITLNRNGGSGGPGNLYYTFNTNAIYSDSSLSTKITKITVPTNSGHTFAKYTGDGTCGGNSGEQYIASDGTIASDLYCDIYKNATLTAQWTANKYYVKYNANGGSGSMSNSEHTYGTAKALTANAFSYAGHDFMGWSLTQGGGRDYTNQQSVINLTTTNGATVNLYAVWTPIQYTLTVNPNGGVWNGTSSNSTVPLAFGTSYTLANPTRIGHTFSSWTKSGTGTLSGSTFTVGAGNGTVTANWTIKSSKLTVDANGGSWSGTTPVTKNYGTTLTIANPTRSNYTFKGWTVNGGGSMSGTTFTFGETDTTITAIWENNSTNMYFYK